VENSPERWLKLPSELEAALSSHLLPKLMAMKNPGCIAEGWKNTYDIDHQIPYKDGMIPVSPYCLPKSLD
jgi:hypothetical protein